MKLGKSNIIYDTDFPEREVKKSWRARKGGVSWSLGLRWFMDLECGHTVGQKGNDKPREKAKCFHCYRAGIK